MTELTIVICTHNPRRDYLGRTLDSLRAQTLPVARWNLLVIDNASTNAVLQAGDVAWHPQGRIVREDRAGLTFARLRAISECETDWILFVDDDNVLALDYAATLLKIIGEFPRLACIGAGILQPEFEEAPASEWSKHTLMLALRSVSTQLWSNDPTDSIIPWGAGLAVLRSVALQYRADVMGSTLTQQLDRCGTQLNSCGDDEFSHVACGMGYGKGLFPELRIVHLIPKSRVHPDYFVKIAEGHAFSHTLLACLHGGGRPRVRPEPSLRGVFRPFGLLGAKIREARAAAVRNNQRLSFRRLISMCMIDLIDEMQSAFVRYWTNRNRSPADKAVAKAERDGIRRAVAAIDAASSSKSPDAHGTSS